MATALILPVSCSKAQGLSSKLPWEKDDGNTGTGGDNEDGDISDAGSTLYNGIVLPDTWPPKNIVPTSVEPMKVPYLTNRPAVVPIDIGRQLFVDDFLIETSTLKRVNHQATKYSGNPILKAESSLEKPSGHFPGLGPKDGGVWWEPRKNKFMMWYEAGWLYRMALATSSDGLHWEKPNIYNGTNELKSLSDLVQNSCAVVLDYDAPDSERYKMFHRQPNDQANALGGSGYSMVSADGITWTKRTRTGPCGDRSTMFYNPFRKKWVYSLRNIGALGFNQMRVRFYHEHSDFLQGANWSSANSVFWCRADKYDPKDPVINIEPELYNVQAVAYESIMLGLHQILLDSNEACKKAGRPKVTVLKTAFSRDGFHWSRPDREPFIDAARSPGTWDKGYIQSVGGLCSVMKDQLWFWYIGFKGQEDRPGHSASMHSDFATGLAYLRRDGFCSMSTTTNGELTTRPVKFSGKHLFVNVDCPEGKLKVEVMDKNYNVIPGFGAEQCLAVTEDSTIKMISWNGGNDLSSLANKEIRFRFVLEKGDLYAFWVSPSENGESMGYVAGGGPGYTSNIDDKGLAAYSNANIPTLQ